MLSNDKNIESIAKLVETLKDYIVLQKEYLKYDVVEKLVKLSAALLLSFFILSFLRLGLLDCGDNRCCGWVRHRGRCIPIDAIHCVLQAKGMD